MLSYGPSTVMKGIRPGLIYSFMLAVIAFALFGAPVIVLAGLTSSFFQNYLTAWFVLAIGSLLCLRDHRIYVSDHTGMCAIFEVKVGFALLVLSVFIATGLFAITGYRELNLSNYLTALSCVFGIFVSFYFLYLVPKKVRAHKELKELMRLQGIGKVYADRLYVLGIRTEQSLIDACQTDDGVKRVSELTGVPTKVLKIATHAALERKIR
jgi:hypothetical protein